MSEYDAGLNTTPGMWQMVSEALEGEKLPVAINEALYLLCEGKARVVLDDAELNERNSTRAQ
jgi:hypothetical protein